MLRVLILLCAASGMFAQTQAPFNRYWDVRGVGVNAAKPATCTAGRHVYLCVGSGCSPNPSIQYCTATNTWTVMSGSTGGAIAIEDVTGLQSALDGKEATITTLSATKGGLGANASAFAGVVKMSGGVASVVTGTSTNCILVDGTSGPCGTGGGGDVLENEIFVFTDQTVFDIEHDYDTKAIVWEFYTAGDVRFEVSRVENISANVSRVTCATSCSGYAVPNRAGWGGDVVGGGGDSTAVQNSGAGAQVLKTTTNVVARTLIGGVGINVAQNEDTITITNTGGSGGGGAGTVVTDVGLLGVGTEADPVRVNPAVVPTFIAAASTVNDWGTIGAAACVEKTVTFAGTLTGDAVIPSWPAALPSGLTGIMRISAINTLAVRLCNATGAGVAVANGFQFGATILRSF